MGNTFGSASTTPRPPPDGVTKVNDSLYVLYSPPHPIVPEVDIVFFHGLQTYNYIDAYLTTWSSNDGKQIWPQTLLSQRFPRARILSVSYDSCAFESATTGRMNLKRIGEALLGDVIESPIAGVGQARPVVLVGHCLGGLVIKRFLLDAQKRASLYNSQVCVAQIEAINKFLDNVKGVFYYATPHGGFDDITGVARKLEWSSDLIDELSTFCEGTERLNQDFNNFRHKYKFSAYALYETQATLFWGGQSGQLVAEASARRDMDQAYPARADHFTICKADSKTSMAFQKLEEFVQGKALNSIVSTRAIPFKKEQEPNKVFGMDHLVKQVKSMLVKERSLGLVGMGGVGKTTLARAVFNALGPTYEYTCFILDVKIQVGDMESLIKERLCHQGETILRDTELLKGKRLLLVLDDVDCKNHVAIVSILCNIGVHEDSRFILTSRDHALLKQDLDSIYEIPFLGIESSKTMLVHYAFRDKEVSPSFEKRIDDVVRKCGMLPLALEVVGKYLYDKSEIEWYYAINVLAASNASIGPNEELRRQLKLSYDGLRDAVEKKMFIEAATMWIGKYLFEFKAAWSTRVEGEEHTRWQHLIDMSLVQVEVWKFRESASGKLWFDPYDSVPIEDGGSLRIRVHEQLQSLALSIAKDSNQIISESEELWERPCEEIAWLKLSECDSETWSAHVQPGAFPHLRVMDLSNLNTHIKISPRNLTTLELCSVGVTSLSIKDFPNLRVLKLKWCDNFSHFSPGKCSNLRVLQLYGCWNCSLPPDIFGQLSQLRSLTLQDMDLKTLPKTFGRLSKLMLLTIASCPLHIVPETFGGLSQLRYLGLELCSELRRLPKSFGGLSALVKLVIRECEALEELCDSFGNLSALAELNLGVCRALKKLPDSFGNLSALTEFSVSDCRALEKLPDSFGNLSALTKLDLTGCQALQKLPDSFGNLSALPGLDLSGCEALEELPDSFGNLSALTKLKLSGCGALQKLPHSFGNLSALTELDLSPLTKFNLRPDELALSGCGALQKLPDSFGNLSALTKLDLNGCEFLDELPDSFGNLSALTKLDLIGCRALQKLPDSFGNLSALTELDLSGCRALQKLPESFGNLSALTKLDLCGCGALQNLPDSLGNFSALVKLDLCGCGALQKLPDSFGNLSALTRLDLNGCEALQKLPDSLGNLSALTRLDLNGCQALQKLPDSFGNLSALPKLDLSGCGALEELPDSFGNLYALTKLKLSGCGALQKLPHSFGNLSALTELDLSPLKEMQKLPDSLGNLSAFTKLDRIGCEFLDELPDSFGNLSALTKLDLSGCGALQKLPESFGNLSALTKLDLSHCGALQKLPDSFGKLSALTELKARRCGALEELPDFLRQFVCSCQVHRD